MFVGLWLVALVVVGWEITIPVEVVELLDEVDDEEVITETEFEL
jgi:hypothetical protein